MPPVLIAGGIAAAGAIGSAVISNSGTRAAAQTQSESNAQNVALQREIYGQNREALAPWQQSGMQANSLYNAALGVGGDSTAANNAFDTFRNSSGYQFRVGEGMNALNNGYAGAGLIRSGAAMQASQELGQNLASAEFGNWMGGLESSRNIGFGAASAQAGVGQNFANNVSSLNSQNANALAALQLQRSNNTAGAIGALGQIGGYVAGNALTSSYQPSNPVSGWGNPGLY